MLCAGTAHPHAPVERASECQPPPHHTQDLWLRASVGETRTEVAVALRVRQFKPNMDRTRPRWHFDAPTAIKPRPFASSSSANSVLSSVRTGSVGGGKACSPRRSAKRACHCRLGICSSSTARRPARRPARCMFGGSAIWVVGQRYYPTRHAFCWSTCSICSCRRRPQPAMTAARAPPSAPATAARTAAPPSPHRRPLSARPLRAALARGRRSIALPLFRPPLPPQPLPPRSRLPPPRASPRRRAARRRRGAAAPELEDGTRRAGASRRCWCSSGECGWRGPGVAHLTVSEEPRFPSGSAYFGRPLFLR